METIIGLFTDRVYRLGLITFGHGEATHRMGTGLAIGTR